MKNYGIFYKTFLTYLVIIIIPIVTIGFLIISKINEQNQFAIKQDFENNCVNISNAVEAKLVDLNRLAESLAFSTWVAKGKSNSSIIYNQLDFFNKNNACTELLNYQAFLKISSNVAVYFPQKQLVVNQRKWWDEKSFFYEVGFFTDEQKQLVLDKAIQNNIIDVSSMKQLGINGKNENDLLITKVLDLLSNPTATMMITINKSSMDDLIKGVNGNKNISVTIKSADGTVYEYQSLNDDHKDIHTQTSPLKYGLECEINMTGLNTGNSQYFYIISSSLFILSIFIAVALSYVLAKLSYSPISKLVSKIGIGKEKFFNGNELSAIEVVFDELITKNDKLELAVEQYYANLRSGFLIKLLEGYFDSTELADQIKDFKLPFNEKSCVVVLLLNLEESDDSAHREDIHLFLSVESYFSKLNLTFERVVLNENQMVLIFNLPQKEAIQKLKEETSHFENWLMQKQQYNVSLTWGVVEKGILGISKSYQYAKNIYSSSYFYSDPFEVNRIQYYYPTDWEVQMINHLKLGKLELACKILDELEVENRKLNLSDILSSRVISLIYETMLRLITELNLDIPMSPKLTPADDEACWLYLKNVAAQICERLNDANSIGIAQDIIKYVEDNYWDYNLSLKNLEDKFSISSSKIFRMFKNTAKITFYDYLCRFRIEKAKEFLKEKSLSVNEVAQKVGYENEASFKRAFYRYEGVRPKAYIDSLLE